MTNTERGGSLQQRVHELEEIREELEIVATSDCTYAKHARRFLGALEEYSDE